MAHVKKVYQVSDPALVLRLQALAEPEVASYIASLKKRFNRYAMPIDEARKVVDSAMGTRTLTELLHEAREQAE
ncbi:MAG: hypothetical protein HYY01_07355 [Chloroflexi bacterium]|nr:hypothetical protein [Chloroflexota bacterium]